MFYVGHVFMQDHKVLELLYLYYLVPAHNQTVHHSSALYHDLRPGGADSDILITISNAFVISFFISSGDMAGTANLSLRLDAAGRLDHQDE